MWKKYVLNGYGIYFFVLEMTRNLASMLKDCLINAMTLFGYDTHKSTAHVLLTKCRDENE